LEVVQTYYFLFVDNLIMTRQSLEYYRNQLMGYYRDQKKLPSYREMMTLFGVKGMRSVSLIVDKLVEAGYIDKSDQGLAP